MTGILADHNVGGHLRALRHFLEQAEWSQIWNGMNCPIETFASLGLSSDSADSLVWQTCQDRGLVLLTGNRNEKGPDSLQATIRAHSTPQSLPVFTISDPDRIFQDRSYAERVAEKLLERLLEIDSLRGTGRL